MTLNTWSKTAANNATADATINWAEGQAPSSVNNSARAVMAAVAKGRDDWAGSLTTGGTSTAYTLTSNQVFASLAGMGGHTLTFRAHTASGESATLNVDSLGAKSLVAETGTALPAAAFVENAIYSATYDNANSKWTVHGYPTAIATQENQETGTSLTAVVTSGRQHYHDSAAKAWVNAGFNGTTNDGFGVSSVTDVGLGDITITFSTVFSNLASMALFGHYRRDLTGGAPITDLLVTWQSTGMSAGAAEAKLQAIHNGAQSDAVNFYAVAFGDQ